MRNQRLAFARTFLTWCILAVTLNLPREAFAQAVITSPPDKDYKQRKFKIYPRFEETVDAGYQAITSGLQIFAEDSVDKRGRRTRYLLFSIIFQPEKGGTEKRIGLFTVQESDLILLRMSDLVRIAKSRIEKKSHSDPTVSFAPAESVTLSVGSNDARDGIAWSMTYGKAIFISMSFDTLQKATRQAHECVAWLRRSKY